MGSETGVKLFAYSSALPIVFLSEGNSKPPTVHLPIVYASLEWRLILLWLGVYAKLYVPYDNLHRQRSRLLSENDTVL